MRKNERHERLQATSETVDVNLLGLTAQIADAQVENTLVSTETLPDLIQSVSRSLTSAGRPEIEQATLKTPAVPIKSSVSPDSIVCLEDGRKLMTLKRHLKVNSGLSPADHGAKWGLPHDYPLVAPNYAATPSGLAKHIGLGQRARIKAGELEANEVKEPI